MSNSTVSEGGRMLVKQILHVSQRGPHTFTAYSSFISQMGSDIEVLLQLEPIGTVLRSHLDAWRNASSCAVPFEKFVFQTFFINLPTCLSADQHLSLGINPDVKNVFEYLYLLQNNPQCKIAYEQAARGRECNECGQAATHRGHCLVAKDSAQFDHFRVKFALVPVFIWLDQFMDSEENKILQWIASKFLLERRELDVEILQSLVQADEALEELAFLMSGIVNDIMEVPMFVDEEEEMLEEEDEAVLDQFVHYVEESCCGLMEKLEITKMVESIEAEHDLICEEVFIMQKQVRQVQDKLRVESDFESDIQRLQLEHSAAELEMAKWKRCAEDSDRALQQAKREHSEKLSVLQAHLQADCELREMRVQLDRARKECAAAKKHYKRAQRLTPRQQGRRHFSCICCEKEGSGVLHPCKHTICLDCFRETQELSIERGVPFLHPNCTRCTAVLHKIDFTTFEFNPQTGREQYKL